MGTDFWPPLYIISLDLNDSTIVDLIDIFDSIWTDYIIM